MYPWKYTSLRHALMQVFEWLQLYLQKTKDSSKQPINASRYRLRRTTTNSFMRISAPVSICKSNKITSKNL